MGDVWLLRWIEKDGTNDAFTLWVMAGILAKTALRFCPP
jgi:hypothetical protein